MYKIQEILKKKEKEWRGGSISQMEGMAIKVQVLDSRKTGGKYMGYKYIYIYKPFHILRSQIKVKMGEDNIYFFLSSIDSSNFHPNIKPYNFTFEVPERTNLIGDWQVGICDFHASTVTNETLYLFSDIADYSYIRNSMQGIIRLLPQSNSNKYQLFNKIYCLPVKTKNFSRIVIYIKNKNLHFASSLTGVVELTLHLRRKR